jgi:hypothetical protein
MEKAVFCHNEAEKKAEKYSCAGFHGLGIQLCDNYDPVKTQTVLLRSINMKQIKVSGLNKVERPSRNKIC